MALKDRDIPPSFIDKALAATPGPVIGFVGSFLATSIGIIAVLKIGGLDAPVNRIVNAYAAGIEANVTRLDKSTSRLEDTAKALSIVEGNLASIGARISQFEVTLSVYSQQIANTAKRVDEVELKLDEVTKSLNDHLVEIGRKKK